MGRVARQWIGAVALAVAGLALMLIVAIGPAAVDASSSERAAAGKRGLKPFSSCENLRRYYTGHRRALPGRIGQLQPLSGAEDSAAAPGAGELTAAAGGGEEPPSSTNVQEAGVDEPDIVKARGSIVFAVADGRLHAVDVGGAKPTVLDSVDLPDGPGPEDEESFGDTQLLIYGDRALAVSPTYARFGNPWWSPATLLAEVEIGDPSQLRVVRSALAEGRYVSGRLTGATGRLVVSSEPPNVVAERGKGRALVPQLRLRDRVARERTNSKLVPCDEVRRPTRFAGAGMLTVLTIDLGLGLPAVDTDAVMTSGEVVYASPTSLYVATEWWFGGARPDELSQANTRIHRFDASRPGTTEYRASGQVPGFMLSQWSMSEHGGVLRVASTTAPPWEEGGETERSQSFLTTLVPDGGQLREVGQVGGLGRGEQIYAVRLIGDRGYVVTFRQVDPLYVLDLSDPTRPTRLGELKVPGYSAYLHPVGERYLLGVGQDADERGRTLGLQVSLFDVGDPAAPARLDVEQFGRNSYSEVEYDHHAFSFFADRGLALIPLSGYGAGPDFVGATGLRIDPAGTDPIGRVAKLEHPGPHAIRRSLVVGDRVYTISLGGIGAHDPTTLATSGFVRFPAD